MFTGILISMLASQGQLTSPPKVPNMDHMVREGVINPLRAKHIVEWFCSKGGKVSRVSISLEDVGVSPRNDRFSFKLVGLLVEGKLASPTIQKDLGSMLANLNNITVLEGGCRQSEPTLVISGHTYEGRYRAPKEYFIKLR